MTSIIIIPNDEMLSMPVPPAYIGKEVEVTFSLVNGASKTAFRKQPILEPDDDFRRSITIDEFIERAMERLDKIDKIYATK